MHLDKRNKWLSWVQELQTIAQAGLTYSTSAYEKERCKDIQRIAAEIAAEQSEMPKQKILGLFEKETGYSTPKIDVRGAVFKEGQILLVRETADANKWTLPGGWGDIGQSPSENVEREVFEETGLRIKAKKLAALYDRGKHVPEPDPRAIYKAFFICDVIGGSITPSFETGEVRWFQKEDLPDESEISIGRSRRYHIERMFEHYQNPDLPTDFD